MAFKQPVECLDSFLEVYGNTYRRIHFLAMRFKRHILHYSANILDATPIVPPHNSILTIRGKCPPIRQDPTRNCLLFTENSEKEGISVPDFSIETLLRMFFPETDILYSHFKCEVLYIVANKNPLKPLLKKCPKREAFKTLYTLWDARQREYALTFQEISQLRIFKRYDRILHHFNRWSALAFALCYHSCVQRTGSCPSAYLGREIFHILLRSKYPPLEPLPPEAFYQCEIMFTDTEPLGVMYLYRVEGNKRSVNYVSPMVVVKPQTYFRDSGSVVCNAWLPLYRHETTWNAYGVKHYLENLTESKMQLKGVMNWLQLQESEKYKLILMDLVQVFKIMFGHGFWELF